jgi:hypothetical protein
VQMITSPILAAQFACIRGNKEGAQALAHTQGPSLVTIMHHANNSALNECNLSFSNEKSCKMNATRKHRRILDCDRCMIICTATSNAVKNVGKEKGMPACAAACTEAPVPAERAECIVEESLEWANISLHQSKLLALYTCMIRCTSIDRHEQCVVNDKKEMLVRAAACSGSPVPAERRECIAKNSSSLL